MAACAVESDDASVTEKSLSRNQAAVDFKTWRSSSTKRIKPWLIILLPFKQLSLNLYLAGNHIITARRAEVTLNGDQYQSLGEKIAVVLFMYVKIWDASKETLFYLARYLFCSLKSP
jgi:hypothetical protein